jgi:cobalt-zinc-cadmium efflux system membrane fusion protein
MMKNGKTTVAIAALTLLTISVMIVPTQSATHDHDHDHEQQHVETPHDDHGHDADVHDHQQQPEQEADEHEGHNHGSATDFCTEHQMLEKVDALCQAGHIGDLPLGQGMMVRLYDEDVAAKTGIVTARPQPIHTISGETFLGQVALNRNRLAKITSPAPGLVTSVHVQPGTRVTQGQALLTVDIPQLATLKSDYLAAQARVEQSRTHYEREQLLLEKGITSQHEFQQARSAALQARSDADRYYQQLLNTGMAADEIDQLMQQRHTETRITLRAPFAATVTDVATAQGERITDQTAVITLANLDTLWLEISVPESQLQHLQADAPIQARFSALPGRVFTGTLFFLGSQIDQRSRMLTALAEIDNSDHLLKAGLYGDVALATETSQQGLAIDANAVQMLNNTPYVFIAHEDDLFEIRRVEVGVRHDHLVALAGVTADEAIVVRQGYALKSEVLKASLGASCADH